MNVNPNKLLTLTFVKNYFRYHFSRTIDRFECEDLRSRTVSDVEQLFHGKFDVENAILPHELETELQIHQSEINTTIPE